MKTFYCVEQKFFDNGKVKVAVHEVKAESKPEDTMESKGAYDEYKDYYTDKRCADNAAASVLRDC